HCGLSLSVASHASTLRSTRHGGSRMPGRSSEHKALPWYKKPLLRNALYTNLQKGAWHVGFYSLILSLWTIFTSSFDIYCLEEAKPGTSHTGYSSSARIRICGQSPVRNLLITVSVFSLFGGIALCITSILLLNGLRKEYEVSFKPYLYVSGVFTIWKLLAWLFCAVVNDMIFAYHIIMFIAWLILTSLTC
ncbi:Uncharacterized protein FKW44_023228, partial [Caligus rogercresseyi]